ncbi:MarR family winged helix-turn-helix transcriptional regulator [Paenibacillus humicola]|uniref:MarR family winged helix-turn-helix transcriptional regulator n=1 Tax=Paenibacillus humicola TaxID=3110540 RepID=UPI00237B272D|nr:MarR family winged helix-turn-helix transcriptional regulator [Paenibacillus humicola]
MSGSNLLDVHHCLCAALRRADRMITQFYDAIISPGGLRATQFTLLATIAEAAPLPINHLADLMGMDRTTLTRNLSPLSKQGWVRIEVGEDHRIRVVTLTKEGRRILAQAQPLWQQAQSQVLDRLGPQHVEALLAELSSISMRNH